MRCARCALLGHHDEQESKRADQEDNYPSRQFSESDLDGPSVKRWRSHWTGQRPYLLPGPRLMGENEAHTQQGGGTSLTIFFFFGLTIYI